MTISYKVSRQQASSEVEDEKVVYANDEFAHKNEVPVSRFQAY